MLAREMRRAQLVELALYAAIAIWLHARGWSIGAAALAIPALVLGVRWMILCTTFGLAWIYRAPRSVEERISFPAAVAMMLREYRALLAMNLLYTPWERFFVRADPPEDAPGEIAVVLIHGYFVNRGCWRPFLRFLEEAKVGPVFIPDCRSDFATIEQFEKDLDAAIERICAQGSRRVVLVGHSMGGLGVRAYLARRGTGRVARVVTIGSPHHGTRLAPWGLGANARQMVPGSAFLVALERREASTAKPEALSIGSAHDNMIMPQDAIRLAWSRNATLRGYGHISLFGAPEVARLVVEEIRAAR